MSRVELRIAKGASESIIRRAEKAIIDIMKTVKNEAIASIDLSKKPSKPGEPVNTPTGRYPQTIKGSYNERTMTASVGPENFGGSPFDGKTLPEGLEYGGTITAPEKYVPADKVSYKLQKREVDRVNKLRRRGKTRPFGPGIGIKDLKYVLIPPKVKTIEARPTMRLAFNKMATPAKLEAAFKRIGIKQPQLVRIQ